MAKLVILTSHPIQYQVPLWQALAREGRVDFEVWFLTDHGLRPSFDREFGRTFAWDLDLLSGYKHRFLSKGTSPDTFFGTRLPPGFDQALKESGAAHLWVQGWQLAAYWQAIWKASMIGISIWMRGETNSLRPISRSKLLAKRLLLGALFSKIDHFLWIGSANRQFYEEYGVPTQRLAPAPYCVDNDSFASQAAQLMPSRPQLRAKFQVPTNAFCIMFCGKLIAKKRPLDLVEAVSCLRLSTRQPHILFVGSGELEAAVRAACVARNISASFAGFLNQTEISAAYVAADCLVLPSDYGETWGLVVNEALASGLPCIVSDACGSAEDLIKPAEPGLVFRLGDTRDLSRALILLEAIKQSNELTWPVVRHHFSKTIDTVAALTVQDNQV